MTAYTYILYPHTRIEAVWANSIEAAIEKVERAIGPDGYAVVCPFGTTDTIEVGKRAVN